MNLGSGILASLVVVSSALAQQSKVGVVAFPMDAASQRQALLAEKALQRMASERADLLDLAAAVQADDAAAREGKAKQAAGLISSASDAVDSLDLPTAVDKLTAAISLLEESDLRTHFPELSNALALRAVALHLGDSAAKAKSDEALAKLFVVSPNYRFPEGRWAPDVQAWLQAGRQTALQMSPISIEVHGKDAVFVYVDGIYRGIAPVDVSDLLPGEHYLSAIGIGTNLSQRAFATESGHVLEPEMELSRSGQVMMSGLDGLKSATTPDAIAQPGKALCTAGGVSQVIALGVHQESDATQLEVFRANSAGGVLRKTIAVSGQGEPALEAAEKQALGIMQDSLQSTGPAGVAVSSEQNSDRRMWSYIAGGGAAAVFIAGVALGASAQGQVNSAKTNLIDQPTQYKSAISNAQTAAAVANVCYGVSVLAVGGAAWLFYSSMQSGPTDPLKHIEEHMSDDHMSAILSPINGGAAVSISGRF